MSGVITPLRNTRRNPGYLTEQVPLPIFRSTLREPVQPDSGRNIPLTHWVFMKIVVVELPAKAKTINKYLGPGYEVLASFGHVRDLPPKDGSVDPKQNFKMIWEVDAKAAKRLADITKAVKGADSAHSRHRPGPRRRGDLLARAGSAEGKDARSRTRRSSAWCSTPSPSRR